MVDQHPVALITGGEGSLAQALGSALEPYYPRLFAPSHGEMDVTSEAAIISGFKSLTRLDLLIHAAGNLDDSLVTRLSERQWDGVISTHLRGAALCAREAVRLMAPRREGCILFIGSYAGQVGRVGQAHYAAAKAGLIGLMQSLAREAGSENIRTHVVCPGFLETRMTSQLKEKQIEQIRDQHTLGRFNTVGDFARFVAHLTTQKNLSGQVFHLDSRLLPWN